MKNRQQFVHSCFLNCAVIKTLKRAILISYLQAIDGCWTHLSSAESLWIQEVKQISQVGIH